jgi:hypothetical protein
MSSWFFWILTHKAWVLYPPKEFGGETGVTTYVEAMAYRQAESASGRVVPGTDETDLIQQVYATKVIRSPSAALPELGSSEDRGGEDGFVVFMGPRRSDSLGLYVDLKAYHSVTDCLAYIGNALLPGFEADNEPEKKRRHDMNYGTTWILREMKTHSPLTDIGPRWAYRHSGNLSDLRRPAETSLQRMVHLELMRLRDESYSIAELLADDEKLLREGMD